MLSDLKLNRNPRFFAKLNMQLKMNEKILTNLQNRKFEKIIIKVNIENIYKRKIAKIRWGSTKTVECCCTRVENVIMSDFY